jgi:predicted metal-dependent HD superfamily phosphohydrolase
MADNALKRDRLEYARFARCLQALGAARRDLRGEFARLESAYAEPGRAYHNSQHIADCLALFDEVRALAQRPGEVEAALWYHDVIYDPRAHDNEERSADWAAHDLKGVDASAQAIERVVALILATQHRGEPKLPDAELLVDIDLSILGRDEVAFAEYDRAIRVEYAWVPEDQYRAGRAAVLRKFLERPVLYRTAPLRERYEAAARRNLAMAIASLS